MLQIRIGADCSIAVLLKLFGELIPGVRKLSLAHSTLTNEHLNAVAKSCPLLETLVLDDCPQVTILPLGLKKLRHFSCASCYRIRGTTLREFVSSCQSLSSMNLFFCHYVVDAGLVNLSINSLRKLDLTNCYKVYIYIYIYMRPVHHQVTRSFILSL